MNSGEITYVDNCNCHNLFVPQMSAEHRAILDAVKQSIAELDAVYPPRFKLFPSRYETWYKGAA